MSGTQSLVAATMFVLGIAGILSLRRREDSPSHLWYFATLAATFTIALIVYLNFRYGWSQSPELRTVEREPRDRDYFFMWTFSLWGLFAGLGLAWLVNAWKSASTQAASGRKLAPLYLVFVFALVPLAGNWRDASRTGQSFTSAWARDVLESVEPNALIITNGDNDSFPLWYAQAVEGLRKDVTIALTPYLGMNWYARQLNRRTKLWDLSDQELDTIPPYVMLETPQRFDHPTIEAVLQPGYYMRDQLLVLRTIKDTFPGRPIYFSMGNFGQSIGLAPYLKRVGLVDKLEAQPVRENPDTVRLPNGFVDIPRSLELWKQYRGGPQLLREGRWIDVASAGVPIYYAVVAQDLALALEARGRHAEAVEIIEQARKIADVVQ